MYYTELQQVGGKSVCIWDFVNRHYVKDKRVLIVLPRRQLVRQIAATLSQFYPTIVMGTDSRGSTNSNVIVASLDTISRRIKNGTDYGDFDLIILDEAHISWNNPIESEGVIKPIVDKYCDDTRFVGFTATPITAAGYRLEGWDTTIYEYDVAWLIENKFLANFNYYSTQSIDTSGLSIQSTGDYKISDMEEVTNTAAALNSIYKNYRKYGKGKKTLIFATSIMHAELITNHFKDKKVKAGIIHSAMKENDIKQVLGDFKGGKFNVLINVSMLTTGFDDPEVGCLIIARPIGSTRLAMQVWGRSLRWHDDTPVVDIVDLCGVYETVALLPDEPYDWNRTKRPKGEAEEVTENDVGFECMHCKQEISLKVCKFESVITKNMSIKTYSCPFCDEVVEEKSLELVKKKVELIKEAAVIDYSIIYDIDEILNALVDLIHANSRGNRSWAVDIHTQCRKGKGNATKYRTIMYSYIQGKMKSSTAWTRLMRLYK